MSYIKFLINQTDASNILSGARFVSHTEIEKLKEVSREMTYSPLLTETINNISLTPDLIREVSELSTNQAPSHQVWQRMNNLITEKIHSLSREQREAIGFCDQTGTI